MKPTSKRHSDYLNIRDKIIACKTEDQLNNLRQLILKYEEKHEDGSELIILWYEQMHYLNPTEDYFVEPLYKIKTL